MKTKSLLTVISITLCSVVAFASADEAAYISEKSHEIKELLSQGENFRPFRVHDLKDLECVSYGKITENDKPVEKDDSVNDRPENEDFKGVSLSKIKDHYSSKNISVYDMPTISHENGHMLSVLVNYAVNDQPGKCILNMTKVGYRFVGELACGTNFNGGLSDQSLISADLYAAEYIECAAPSVAL